MDEWKYVTQLYNSFQKHYSFQTKLSSHPASVVSLTIQLLFFFEFLFLIWLDTFKKIFFCVQAPIPVVCLTKPVLAISSDTLFIPMIPVISLLECTKPSA